ncbi:MAG TPA: S8 family serine peptidase [Solirubrobacterales bacterium]
MGGVHRHGHSWAERRTVGSMLLFFVILASLVMLLQPPASSGAQFEFAPGTETGPDMAILGGFDAVEAELGDGDAIPGRYIVVLEETGDPGSIAEEQVEATGGELGLVFSHALDGYSAELSREAVSELREDPRVRYVTPDRVVEASAQIVPTGISRAYADKNPGLDIDGVDDVRVNADVAVIDSGIDPSHPDLNLYKRTDCVPAGEDPEDPEESAIAECIDGMGTDKKGHGTHVAGTIGAIDNDKGVVGVAPGARLWAVRALNKNGSGAASWIIAGVDWVTAHSSEIDVANMSLGCVCSLPALDTAINESVEAGVVYVVAAGNDATDIKNVSPASNPNVITVSALADYDGKPGGAASGTLCQDWGPDDTLATFSNFGEGVEVAAPGVCIESTLPGGGYGYDSGTSMAAPHVAGTAALVASELNPSSKKDVEAVRAQVVEAAEQQWNPQWADTAGDGEQEPLLDVHDIGRAETRTPTVKSTTEVTLRGMVRPGGLATSYRFEYGKTSSYGTSVPVPNEGIGSSSEYVEVSRLITGLASKTPYHFRVVATNSAGTFYSADREFGTSKPAASTGEASEVRANDAILHGTVNPEGLGAAYYFEFGPTSSYGHRTPLIPKGTGGGTTTVPVEVLAAGLTGSWTYHFRLVAQGLAGTVYGADQTFTTPESEWTAQALIPEEPHPETGSFSNAVRSVSCVSKTDCMAVGNYLNTVEQSDSQRWDGEEWTPEPMAVPSEGRVMVVLDVSCVEGDWCVAVGAYSAKSIAEQEGLPLLEYWDGSKWSAETLPLPVGEGTPHKALGSILLNSVSCASPDSCMAVGATTTGGGKPDDLPLAYSWDGDEWSLETVPLPTKSDSRNEFMGVDCTSASFCMAVGLHTEPTQVANSFAEVWDGDEWTLVQDALPEEEWNYLEGVSCISPSDCTVLIGHNPEMGNPHIERWDGSGWEDEWLPKAAGATVSDIVAVDCTAPDVCVAVGQSSVGSGGIVPAAYYWNGEDWSIQSTTVVTQEEEGSVDPTDYLLDVSCGLTSSCFAAGAAQSKTGDYLGVVQRYEGPGPITSTAAATHVGGSNATLRGSVNPGGKSTTYYFEYGESESYGSKTATKSAGSGTSDVEVSEPITGLEKNTTYHYRLVAENQTGTANGEDKTFTTAADERFSFDFAEAGSGDGQLDFPLGVATDSSGNIFVVDTANHRIQKFNSSGEYIFQFGSYGTGDGQLSLPYGVAIDSSGNIWVTDCGNNRVQKFKANGEYLSKFGSKGTGEGQFDCPTGIAFDSSGRAFIADKGNNRVQKFKASGEYLAQFGSKGSGNGQFSSPHGVALDTKGRIWVADMGNNRLQRFNPSTLEYQKQVGSQGTGNGQFESPSEIAIDVAGRLWVTDVENERLQRFTDEGQYIEQLGTPGTGPGQFDNPRGIATPSPWQLLIIDTANNRVQKWEMVPDPPIATTKAATEVKATSAKLNGMVNPEGSATDYYFEYGLTEGYGRSTSPETIASGTESIAVSATVDQLVEMGTEYHYRLVAENGVDTTYGADKTFETPITTPLWALNSGISGEGGSQWEPPQFDRPHGVAIDAEGNIWVADYRNNHRVQKLSPTGEFILMVGNEVNKTNSEEEGTSEAEQDLCTAASGDECGPGVGFESPNGIAIDLESGDIWVSDSYYGRIKHYNSEGEFLDQFGTPGSGEGQLNSPRGIAFNQEGDLLVVDGLNNCIVKFTPEGEFLDQFGAEGEGNGQFKSPSGVSVGPDGNIWVADTANHRIQKFDAEGEFLAKYGTYGSGNGKFSFPYSLAVDPHGVIWVADSSNNRIQAFNSQGKYLTKFGTYGSGDGQLYQPKALAFDAKGDIWVADANNDRIQRWIVPGTPKATTGGSSAVKATSAYLYGKVNPEGNATYHFEYDTTPYKEGEGPHGTSVPAPAKSIGPANQDLSVSWELKGISPITTYHFRLVASSEYGTSYGEDKTFSTSADDRFAFAFGKAGSGNGQLKGATGIATTSSGDFLVVDTENNRVQKFSDDYPFGEYLFQFGKEGAGNGEFKAPKGIAVDSSGNIWVTDTNNNRVQKFDSAGKYLSQFGTEGTGNGQFKGPTGITIDFGGKAWVTDTGNDRVQRFNSSGEYLEKFGETGSMPGQLDGPTGITSPASSWKLIFVDASNNRVQQWEMTPDPPVATTEAATEVKSTSATLNATINPNGIATSYHFEYGKTTSYGTSVPVPDQWIGGGFSPIKVSKAISGLASATKYNFRVVATNYNNKTTKGNNKTFTTP